MILKFWYWMNLEAGLDPQSRILVRGLIKELAEEKTIVITTHNMDEADRLSDRVAIIDHGKTSFSRYS